MIKMKLKFGKTLAQFLLLRNNYFANGLFVVLTLTNLQFSFAVLFLARRFMNLKISKV